MRKISFIPVGLFAAAACTLGAAEVVNGDDCNCDCFGFSWGEITAYAESIHRVGSGCMDPHFSILEEDIDDDDASAAIVECLGGASAVASGDIDYDTYDTSECGGTFSKSEGSFTAEGNIIRENGRVVIQALFDQSVSLLADADYDCGCDSCDTIFSSASAEVNGSVSVPFDICQDDTKLLVASTLGLPPCGSPNAVGRWRVETPSGFRVASGEGTAARVITIRSAGQYRLVATFDAGVGVSAESGCSSPGHTVRTCGVGASFEVTVRCDIYTGSGSLESVTTDTMDFPVIASARRGPFHFARHLLASK